MKKLVAYYSRSGENYFGGSIKNIEKGNTEIVADKIAKLVEADVFKIEQKVPYSNNYSKCTKQAQKDLQEGVRPELTNYLDNIDEYDEIYLGYPNYWGTCPVAVFTFLEKYDFSNKVIHPFCTNEGSGMGSSERDIQKECNATVDKGLAIRGSNVNACDTALESWINK